MLDNHTVKTYNFSKDDRTGNAHGREHMKVLLINPNPKHYYKSSTCPLGLLAIATYLNQRRHEVKIVDSVVQRVHYKSVIKSFQPDVVGISVISYKSIADAIIASKVARAAKIPVVWGGPLASIIPETVLSHGCVDYVVIGEGEVTFEKLLESLAGKTPLSDIDGLAYRKENEICINKDRAFADLADFPVSDWNLVDPAVYFQQLFSAEKMLYIYSGKGCPGQCSFCFNKGFNKCVYRKRPFEYCVEEIAYLTANWGMNGVHFADELWCRNRDEMIRNCDMLSDAEFSVYWGCNARIGTYEKEDFEYMYRAGCRWIFFGVESGSDAIQETIKKGIDLRRVEETVNHCADAGIVPVTSFIIGFPDETPEQLKATVALAKRIPRAMYDFNFFFPLTGSEMCDALIEQGRYSLPKTLEEYSRLIPTETMQFNFSAVPTKELKVVRAFFMWSSFTRKGDTSASLRQSFAKKVFADVLKGLFGRGIKNFFSVFAVDVKTFSDIVFSLLLHPGIRKKYGLYRD